MKIAVCGLIAFALTSAVAADAVDTVKARLVEEARKGRWHAGQVNRWIGAQRTDGAWDDIPYEAKDRMLWPPIEHLDRLAALASAFASDGYPADKRAALEQAFTRGFDFWTETDPKSSNWWYNEIGAPQSLYRTMLLAEPLLTDGRVEKGCALLARAKLGMTGQNLVWLAENVIGRACLQRDAALMAEAFKRIEAEIVVTEGEGIQPDFSFHQHGAQLYSGGYGNGFAGAGPRFALLAQGTPFAFAPEKIRIMENYLLDGQQWMIRGRQFDYSACGREPTRPDSGKVGAYAANAQTLLALDAATRRAELERFAVRIQNPATPLTGHRHFWRADYTTHHTPAWMVSVRMTSTRLLQTEEVNSENMIGEHLSDGVMYLYPTGDEYRNIFPVWDWKRLPGITVEHDRPHKKVDNRRRGARAFAGGVTDGTDGVSAMDFERDGLTARKAWFFIGDAVVCLGTGITSTNAYRVLTSINQCLAQGAVTIKRADGGTAVLTAPEKIESPAWVHHGGIGYVFLDADTSIGVGASSQTGNWKRISTPQSPDPVSMDVFSLWINHGKQPQNASYAYVATPQQDATTLDAFAQTLPVRVLANTPQTQAIATTDNNTLQIAFYEAATISAGANWNTITTDTPCLLILKRDGNALTATVSNPLNKGGRVRLTAGDRSCEITFPDGQQAGSSVSARF